MSNQRQNEALRGIVSAVLVDLCGYMAKLDAPMVIGGEYSPDNIITIFENYCYDRSILLEPHDQENWEALYISGSMTTMDIAKPERRLRFKNG